MISFFIITFIIVKLTWKTMHQPIFISHQEFKNIISKSSYFDSLTPQDLQVRMINNEKVNYTKYYIDNIRDFSASEKAHVAILVDQANKLTSCFPRLHNIPWKFAKVDAHVENGFPHTLGDTIVLSDRFFNIHGDHIDQIKTIIHEKVHVFQRFYPQLTDNLIESWGFKKIKHMSLTDLPSDRRSNPDIQHVYEKDGYIPYQRFTSSTTSSLSQSVPVLISSTSSSSIISINKLELPNYITQVEHPYEMMAVIIPIVLCNERKEDRYYKNTEEWIRSLRSTSS